MIITILADRVNFDQDIKEVRQAWMEEILGYIGMDTDFLTDLPKDKIIEYFIENEIEVIEYTSLQAIQIKYKGELIGEWAGPEMKLKQDKDGKLYFEVKVETWSIQEDEIDT